MFFDPSHVSLFTNQSEFSFVLFDNAVFFTRKRKVKSSQQKLTSRVSNRNGKPVSYLKMWRWTNCELDVLKSLFTTKHLKQRNPTKDNISLTPVLVLVVWLRNGMTPKGRRLMFGFTCWTIQKRGVINLFHWEWKNSKTFLLLLLLFIIKKSRRSQV